MRANRVHHIQLILTHLLLQKLHKEHLNDFYQHNKKINVTILVDHNADYWSYHTLMQPEYAGDQPEDRFA